MSSLGAVIDLVAVLASCGAIAVVASLFAWPANRFTRARRRRETLCFCGVVIGVLLLIASMCTAALDAARWAIAAGGA